MALKQSERPGILPVHDIVLTAIKVRLHSLLPLFRGPLTVHDTDYNNSLFFSQIKHTTGETLEQPTSDTFVDFLEYLWISLDQ